MLKSVGWKDIRDEKFPLTPISLFEYFASRAELLMSKHVAEMERRLQWLSSTFADDEDESAEPTRVSTAVSNQQDLLAWRRAV